MSVIDWLEGPLWKASAAIFVIFALWRLGAMLTTGRRHPEMPAQGSPALGALRTTLGHFLPRRVIRKRPKTWFVTLAGYAFHLGLFTLLLAAQPHVEFIRAHIVDVELPVLPRWGFIVAAEFAFAALLALWVRRFVDPVVRLISRHDDYVGAGLTFVVMLTGCMALGPAERDAARHPPGAGGAVADLFPLLQPHAHLHLAALAADDRCGRRSARGELVGDERWQKPPLRRRRRASTSRAMRPIPSGFRPRWRASSPNSGQRPQPG